MGQECESGMDLMFDIDQSDRAPGSIILVQNKDGSKIIRILEDGSEELIEVLD